MKNIYNKVIISSFIITLFGVSIFGNTSIREPFTPLVALSFLSYFTIFFSLKFHNDFKEKNSIIDYEDFIMVITSTVFFIYNLNFHSEPTAIMAIILCVSTWYLLIRYSVRKLLSYIKGVNYQLSVLMLFFTLIVVMNILAKKI